MPLEPTLLSIAAADGARSSPRLFAAASPHAALLILPAMGVNARSYDPFARALAGAGVTTLVAEHRGGESSSVRAHRGVDYGYAELLSEWPLLLEALRGQVPAALPLDVLGHSMGGQLAVAALARWHRPGARLVLVASGTVHYRAWTGVGAAAILAGTVLAAGVAHSLGYFPGHRLGFGGLQGRALIVDWARASRTGVFSIGGQSFEQGLDAPLDVLAVSVAGDTYAPAQATRALLGKLPRATVRFEAIGAPAMPRALNPHFRWLRAPRALSEVVARFLRRAPG